MLKYLFLFLGLIVFTACIPKLGTSDSVKSVSVPQNETTEGGQDLGGGDSSTELAGMTDIQKELEIFHLSRKELFTALEYIGLTSERILSSEKQMSVPLSEKEKILFQKQSRIYNRLFKIKDPSSLLAQIHLQFETNKPCFDLAGNEKDGSVHPDHPETLCISLYRLSKKLNKSNYQIESLALYLHEISHSFQTTEEEAVDLQNQILSIGPEFKKFLPFLLEDSQYSKPALRENVLSVLSKLENLSETSLNLCQSLKETHQFFFDFIKKYGLETRGLSVFSIPEIISLHSAYVLSSYLPDYCDLGCSLAHQMKIKTMEPIPLLQLYPDPTNLAPFLDHNQLIQYSQYFLADLSEARVQWIPVQDFKKLKSNIDQIRLQLQFLKDPQ